MTSLPEVAAAPVPRAKPASLTRSATLTAVASLLDYAAKLVVGLVLTPILVSGLGRTLFGVWTMLQQLVVYMNATDGRPTEALRLVISSDQANADVARKRRFVGAAVVVWLIFLPVIAAVGATLVWLAPKITKVQPELITPVRLTCALLVLSFLAATLASIPESVLRGMNLGYKRMGWQAGLNVIGGALMAIAIALGLGLTGLGAAQIITAAVTGLVFWAVVRKAVPSFGIARPTQPEVRSQLTMSAWLTGGTIVTHLLLHSDAMILGIVTSPAVVTTYALTRYAVRTATGLLDFTVGAAIPGLGGVIGQRQFERAAQIRGELMALTWLFVTTVGATILLWNRSFLSLWVGGHLYAGAWVNLLSVCLTLQTAFIRSDSYILDAALQPRLRVVVTAAAAIMTIPLSLALTRIWGLVGLCVAIFFGRLIQTVAYPVQIARCLERARSFPLDRIARPAVVTALLFAATAFLGERVDVHHWITWAAGVALTVATTLGIVLFVGLPASLRNAVLVRYKAMGRAFFK